jgi:hypothetical protein
MTFILPPVTYLSAPVTSEDAIWDYGPEEPTPGAPNYALQLAEYEAFQALPPGSVPRLIRLFSAAEALERDAAAVATGTQTRLRYATALPPTPTAPSGVLSDGTGMTAEGSDPN